MLALAGACSSVPGFEARSTASEARRLVREEGALLLDVRTADEFAADHVEGAVWLAHDEIAERLDEIEERLGGDRAWPIVLYCRSGRRSHQARLALEQAGFTRVLDLGAMSNWCEAC